MEITNEAIEAEVLSNTCTIVGNSTELQVQSAEELELYISKREYNIVGDSVYIGNSGDEAPAWINTAIQNAVNAAMQTSKANFDALLAELQVAKNAYYEQVNINSTINSVIASHLTTLNATVGEVSGSIVDLDLIYATKDEAIATSTNILNASIDSGRIKSTVGDLTSAISTIESTSATSYNSLKSEFDDNAAYIETNYYTRADADSAIASATDIVSAEANGLIASIASGDSVIIDGNTYKIEASKLSALPDGSVTGWSFIDGSNMQSEFKIFAEKFEVSDGSIGYVPFKIENGKVYFKGAVQFSAVENAPATNKTFVQPEEPVAGMLNGDIWVDTNNSNKIHTFTNGAWVETVSGSNTYLAIEAPTQGVIPGDIWINPADNYIQYRYDATYGWETIAYNPVYAINGNTLTTTIDGGMISTGTLDADRIIARTSLNAPNIYGGNINGVNITGANITGAIIKASWMDYSSFGVLTNWQFFGLPGNSYGHPVVPSQYVDNFAKSSANGVTLIDGSGFVRLPKTDPVVIPKYDINRTVTSAYTQNFTTAHYIVPFFPYDNYMSSNTNRAMNKDPMLINQTPVSNMIIYRAFAGYGYKRTYTSVTGIIKLFDRTYEYYVKCDKHHENDPTARELWLKENGSIIAHYTYAQTNSEINYSISRTINGITFTFYLRYLWQDPSLTAPVVFTPRYPMPDPLEVAGAEFKITASFGEENKIYNFTNGMSIEYLPATASLTSASGTSTMTVEQHIPKLIEDTYHN